jgi:hypothetical protein
MTTTGDTRVAKEQPMRRLLFVAALGVLGTTAAGADESPKEKVLFEERFAGGLGKGWSWLREEPKAWKIEEGALVLRTLPDYLHANFNDSRNVLLRPLVFEEPISVRP